MASSWIYLRMLAEGERWHLGSASASEGGRFPARCGRVEDWEVCALAPLDPTLPICDRCFELERVLQREPEPVAG